MNHAHRPTTGSRFTTALACLAVAGPACAMPLAHYARADSLLVETAILLSAGIFGLLVSRRHASRKT